MSVEVVRVVDGIGENSTFALGPVLGAETFTVSGPEASIATAQCRTV